MSEDTRDVLWSTCVLQTIAFYLIKISVKFSLTTFQNQRPGSKKFRVNSKQSRVYEISREFIWNGFTRCVCYFSYRTHYCRESNSFTFNKIIIKLWSTVKSFNSRSELIQIKCNLVLECAINVVWMVLFLFWSLLPEGRLQSLKNLVDDREISK